MKPSHLHGTDCRPVAEILSRVGDKWSVMLVMNLDAGTTRFTELRRALHGISKKKAHDIAARPGARRVHHTDNPPDHSAKRGVSTDRRRYAAAYSGRAPADRSLHR